MCKVRCWRWCFGNKKTISLPHVAFGNSRQKELDLGLGFQEVRMWVTRSLFTSAYRGASLIRNSHPSRTTI